MILWYLKNNITIVYSTAATLAYLKLLFKITKFTAESRT
ncbi:hypothetical protein A1OE_505 [Candidatus Endolissoclinum faulkneri L2]|uniref:Uncharacterized protein n=1 Tax=Candidatus Endolissoclinum faulkneri L2 TaxID=1193729 RepID=K7Z3W6_9PROT|nr:hypothetical protein A1OE_505 [Candidatus Endolissoclinum faulkneri L2]